MVFSFNSGYHQHRISILLQTDMGSSMSWVIRLIKDIERINDHIHSRCMLLNDQMCSWICLEKGCPEINFDIWIFSITCIPNGFHALYYGVGFSRWFHAWISRHLLWSWFSKCFTCIKSTPLLRSWSSECSILWDSYCLGDF